MREFIIIALLFFFRIADAQNYLGYSKQYIMKALKSQREDMKGPVEFKVDTLHFISYVTEDKKRAVFYYFEKMTVPLKSGKKSNQEICVKYVSKNMCASYSKCPEKDEVIRSLDSRFTSAGFHIWMDYSKKIPQEWVLVEDENYFEVHVTEKKE